MENTEKHIPIGTKVKIYNDVKNFGFNAGKLKTITGHLPDFGKSKAYSLDCEDGIWCEDDFEEVLTQLAKEK